jgi:AbrB family looped-hinge helix DNA binding protein
MKARVTTKGRVTIPKPLRDRLGIRPGHEVEFELGTGRRTVRLAGVRTDPIYRVVGILHGAVDVDAYLGGTRGPGYDPELDPPGPLDAKPAVTVPRED